MLWNAVTGYPIRKQIQREGEKYPKQEDYAGNGRQAKLS
jgi:hypothetical protein